MISASEHGLLICIWKKAGFSQDVAHFSYPHFSKNHKINTIRFRKQTFQYSEQTRDRRFLIWIISTGE